MGHLQRRLVHLYIRHVIIIIVNHYQIIIDLLVKLTIRLQSYKSQQKPGSLWLVSRSVPVVWVVLCC